MTNVSRLDVDAGPHVRDVRLDWAAWWIAQGAQVFVLAVDDTGGKVPARQCDHCREKHTTPELKEACTCLLCHGFYAATDDLARVATMYARLPDGHLAVRTGRVSNLLVLDVEPTNRLGENNPRDWGRLPAGLDVLDHWEEWVPGGWSLPTTLTARSVSGGIHLYFRYPDVKVPTGGYVLPNIEVKSDGNYVGVPCGGTGRVLTNVAPIASMPLELVALLTIVKRVGGGSGGNGHIGAAGGGDQLPPTEEFIARGLGWFTGSRNRDAYRLACRLWMKLADESDVLDVVRRCWDATPNQSGSSWWEIERTVRSAGQRMTTARDEDAAYVAACMNGELT
jgi:hypothetical protein